MPETEHERYMQRALELARLGAGYTSPNPMVGALVVKDGAVVGEGYHHRAGEAHAEVNALRDAGAAAQGATLYVTLEPCNHHGRTPPCTDAILQAGIRRVVYAVADPHAQARGGGQRLREAGLDVDEGVGAAAAAELNRFFLHHVTTGNPYVIAKFAASLDGKIATRTGHSRWITGAAARQRVHVLRHEVDAILVGAGTVRSDNPRLTARPDPAALAGEPRHPLRVVLDSRGRLPLGAAVFDPELPGQTVVAATAAMSAARRGALAQRGVAVLELPENASGRVSIPHLLPALGARGVQSLLVEGGSAVLGAFRDAGCIDEVWAFLAPLLIGGEAARTPFGGMGSATLGDALRLQAPTVEPVGADVLIRGRCAAVDPAASAAAVTADGSQA